MTLLLTGTATSQGVPVIGCHCPVCDSRDPRDRRLRMAAVLRSGNERLAIDAGPDFRTQMLASRTERLDGILLTHEHNDHTAGLDDVRPFCFKQRMDMPIYCLPRVAREVRERFAYTFTDYPGVPRLNIQEKTFGDSIPFGDQKIELLEVSHGSLPIFGFRIGGLAYLTDVKELPDRTKDRLQNLGTLAISCLNRVGTHSHLSLEESLAFIAELKPKRAVLIHVSHRLGTVAELQAELPAGIEIGYDGMVLPL